MMKNLVVTICPNEFWTNKKIWIPSHFLVQISNVDIHTVKGSGQFKNNNNYISYRHCSHPAPSDPPGAACVTSLDIVWVTLFPFNVFFSPLTKVLFQSSFFSSHETVYFHCSQYLLFVTFHLPNYLSSFRPEDILTFRNMYFYLPDNFPFLTPWSIYWCPHFRHLLFSLFTLIHCTYEPTFPIICYLLCWSAVAIPPSCPSLQSIAPPCSTTRALLRQPRLSFLHLSGRIHWQVGNLGLVTIIT